MHWSALCTIALAALLQPAQAGTLDGWTSLVSPKGVVTFGSGGDDGSLWIQVAGSSVQESVSNGDYIDASGFLPDATTFQQQTSHSSTITTTIGFKVGGSSSPFDGASLTAEFSLTQSIADTTSETETTTITIKCGGARGKVQFQPLFTQFTGNLCAGFLCWLRPDQIYAGKAWFPEVSESGGQLSNFQVVCEEEHYNEQGYQGYAFTA